MTTYKKKLIEVAMPLEAINKASAREKSIRHGHPSTLHLYWARRPLAACRAVLFAQLVDDPSAHTDKFPTEADQQKERERLFGIMEELVIWENSTNDEVLKRAHAEILKSWDGELPPIHDPFSGGGSIPLEAQRLGLPAYGSDLNPVAVMIGKAMIEIPPLFKDMKPIHPGGAEKMHYKKAEGLAEDVKYYGAWMRKKAFERIGHLYPKVDLPKEYGGGQATVIAWIWARTVPSPDPALGGLPVPLIKSFDLSTKKGREAWVEPIIEENDYRFEVRTKEQGHKRHDLDGTVDRNGAFCIVSKTAMPLSYIRQEAQKGNMKQRLMAIVAEGSRGRYYLSPSNSQVQMANKVSRPSIDDLELVGKTRVSLPLYGMKTFGDMFTDRQLVALSTFSDLVHGAREQIEQDALVKGFSSEQTSLRDGGTGAKAYAEAISVFLTFVLSRCANYSTSLTIWGGEFIVQTFGRQALPMVWDYAEGNPFSNSTGNILGAVEWVYKCFNIFPALTSGTGNHLIQDDAQTANFPVNAVVSTDPPYYDNISYADLSDFFFTWMKPALKSIYPDLFSVVATPKMEELVATPYRHDSKDEAEAFFLSGMKKAIKNIADNTSTTAPATIYYAFKQSEIEQEGISSTGWATFLQAVIEAGYAVVGTWPMRLERTTGLKAGKNVLATAVVLVCRKRQGAAEEITRAEFIRALKRELPPAIKELQAANVSAADMPQSAIGPGIGIFSRYKAVREANDEKMTVKTALQLINAELDEFLNDLHGDFDPDTRFATTWFEQHGADKGEYGAADNLARARGISVESVKHAGIVDSSDGKVRILKRNELDPEWNPETDTHLTIWECCQHLIRVLEKEGEQAAAELLKKMGSANAEQVKDLAYYLYDVCAKKRQDAKEATAYNGLIAVWSELTNLSNKVVLNPEQQTTMDI